MLLAPFAQAATLKKGALLVSSTQSLTGTVIAGQRGVRGLYGRLDTTTSSQSTVTVTLPVLLTLGGGAAATDVHNVTLRMLDGTPLNSGVNVLNPTKSGPQLITLDGTGLLTRVGSFQDFVLEFNLSTGATGTYQWSLPADLSAMQSVGLETAERIVPTLVGDGRGPLLISVKGGEIIARNDRNQRKLYRAGINTTVGEFVLHSLHEKMEVQRIEFGYRTTNVLLFPLLELRIGTVVVGRAPLFPDANISWTTSYILSKSSRFTVAPEAPLPIKLVAEESYRPGNQRGEIVTELLLVEAVGVESGWRVVYRPSFGSLNPYYVSLDETRIERVRREQSGGLEAVVFDFVIPEDGRKYVLEESSDLRNWLPKTQSIIFEGPDDGVRDSGGYGNIATFPTAFYRLRELVGPLPQCSPGSYLIVDANGTVRCR